MQITIDNITLNLRKIGKGAFSTIYENVENTSEVYAIVKTDQPYDKCDMSKEAMSSFATGDHVPEIEKVAYDFYVSRMGYCDVYKMKRYYKLETGSQANTIANALIRIYKSVTNKPDYYRVILNGTHYQAAIMIIDAILESSDIPESIKESIDSIYSACTNYGDHYMVEFFKRNMMQDEKENLILLDIAFNAKAL